MILPVGIVIPAYPIYIDEEEFDTPEFYNITFYQITATYKANNPIVGKGTIIISDGIEYFTKVSEEHVENAIQQARAREGISYIFNN